MPFSQPTFDAQIELYFQDTELDTILDIGPGDGKFGKMLRRVRPLARRIAVEIEPAYVDQYGLRELYDEVLVMDAARLMEDASRTFGAVIIGDAIEHLRKSVGIDLLNFLVYRTKVIFVKYPVQIIQDDWQGHPSEAHVSVWSEPDFGGFDHLFVESDPIHMAVIRGYRNRAVEWLPRRFVQAFGYESCAAYYNEQPARWRRAASPIVLRRQRGDEQLASLIAPGEKVILIDEEKSGLLADASHRRIPFLERDGTYYGMPLDDAEALAELARQRAVGARWVVITEDSFWVRDFYPSLMAELHTKYRCMLDTEGLLVFQLNE